MIKNKIIDIIQLPNKLLFGNFIIRKPFHSMGLEFIFWNWTQAHKWRWHRTHIDFGILSIYNLPQTGWKYKFWEFIAFLIKPMRRYYHKKYVYSKNKKSIENCIDVVEFKN